MNTSDRRRRQWCAALAKLVSPSFPVEATEALVDMLPALKHLPDELFNEKTLTHTAMAKRRQTVPAFDEIVRALNDYRATFVPDPTLRLAARPNSDLPPERQPPTPEEVQVVTEMLTSWRQEMAQRQLDVINREQRLQLPDVTLKGEALRALRERRARQDGQSLAQQEAR